MRYFLDTEFNERPGRLELISIGLVSECGTKEYYAVSNEFKAYTCNPWVRENVLPYLGDIESYKSISVIKEDILNLLKDDKWPTFWGYYADYDWVLFCWIFGAMVDLPSKFPHYCKDLKQVMDMFGIKRDQLPESVGDMHNALDDAKWHRDIYLWLKDNLSTLGVQPHLENIVYLKY